jgi:hypothetical protein
VVKTDARDPTQKTTRVWTDELMTTDRFPFPVRQDPQSWQAGYNAGMSQGPTECPPEVPDELAWHSGFIEGVAARQRAIALQTHERDRD